MSTLEPAATPFVQLAQNNRLANHRLLTALMGLDQTAFQQKRVSFFPSLWQTLNHNLTVDWYYVDALEGGTLGAKAWENETPFASAQDLRNAQADVDDRLIDFCRRLTVEKLANQVKLRDIVEPTQNVLLHLFQHQIHHRGQAHAMMADCPVKPPQLDEFLFQVDVPYRQKDLAEIGWTEADLV